jgi:hypothetical protein
MHEKLTHEELMVLTGGRKLHVRGAEVFDFGWRPSTDKTYGGTVVPHQATEDVPELAGDRILLTDFIQPALAAAGLPLMFNWQLTGSCVNGGAQDALIVRIGMDVAVLKQAEAFRYPFTLGSYGWSRHLMGDEREGEGSSGDLMARALRDFGATHIDDPAIPERPHFCGAALVYDRDVELKYSSARNGQAVKGACSPYKITYGEVNNADDAVRELRRGRPLTWCGDWGGLTTVPEQNGVLLNHHSGSWSHQEACLGFWIHPQLGLIFWIQNQWWMPGSDMKVQYVMTREGRSIGKILQPGTAVPIHGMPRNGEPQGGYWIKPVDMNYQAKNGEVRSLISFEGYKDGTVSVGA